MKLKKEPASTKSPFVTCPAIKVRSDGDVAHYITAIPARQLYAAYYVSRADEDPQKGFQRNLSEKRANSIAQYLDDENVIPGAVILSAKEVAEMTNDEKTRTIRYRDVPKAFFVIDGQHRLFGAQRAKGDVVLAVSILTALDLEEYSSRSGCSRKPTRRTHSK